MVKKLVLVPVNLGSRSAKALANVLTEKVGHKVWRVKEHRIGKRVPFRFRPGIDKLTQFKSFKENNVSCPDFTTDRGVAAEWVRAGDVVVCRTLLRSSEGRGIVVAESVDQLVQAPLYTKYVKKKKEFRVHVLDGEVIDVQEKRKRKGVEDEQRNTRIRNVANGYVFCREAVVEPQNLREVAVQAVLALGYRLGACDVVYNERSNNCYVLEVNATPGMEGTTLQKYADKITAWYHAQR